MRSRLVLAILLSTATSLVAETLPRCTAGPESGLPLPSSFARNNDPAAYQTILGNFLRAGTYEKLGWCEDKTVRDTGPWINNAYYGTHPAVRVWYSPAVAKWVMNGRHGDLPDGAMIIKEQFAPMPAGQYQGWTRDQLHTYFAEHYDWTIMVRDRKGAADGWYWGEIFKDMSPDSYAPPFAVFNGGFGLYCVRCHGSAESLMTFSSQINIKDRPGQPLTFRDDLSWFWSGPVQPPSAAAIAAARRTREEGAPLEAEQSGPRRAPESHPHVSGANIPRLAVLHPAVSGDWASFFRTAVVNARPNPLPGENYDHVVSPAGKPQHFVTSDQCFGCHSGNRYGNVMLWTDTRVDSKPLVNISPYGEWRWSPMGLAGRDPIFYAQLDSEIAFLERDHPDQRNAIVNLCFSCHNAMGQRQMELDSGKAEYTTAIPKITDLADPRFTYGALGREGISCAVCHHIKSTEGKSEMQFIEEDATGRFQYTPATELEGPFEKPVTIPMQNSLNIKPVHDSYTQSGRICGACHTIHLPVIDAKAEPASHSEECHVGKFSYEQATYLEWVNSAFQNVINPSKNAGSVKTCQDCHMLGTLNGNTVQTQIAAVEDQKYPAADFRAPNEELDVPIRASGYARHQFQGLNVFLLAMFDQYSDALGVRKCDYMSSGCSGQEPASGIPFAMRNFLEQAAEQTAKIAVSRPVVQGSTLTADVTVTNLTGHRFPSGVSFRRAFIDFKVVDSSTNKILFESGATNSIGAIVDMSGTVLPSESNGSTGPGGHDYQPHFWSPGRPITSDKQVQIYEELLKDADGNFTTSFLRQDCHFKDNRILPLGWRKSGPDIGQFFGKPLEETWSDATGDDPHYQDPLGANGQSAVRYSVALPAGTRTENVLVSAQLYYQAVPPYYLLQRFQQAPEREGTQRLYYVTSTLDTTKTPFPGWKLLVAQATP